MFRTISSAFNAFAVLALLSGCSTISGGPMQDIEIISVPPGASCVVTQANKATWRHAMITGHEEVKFQTIATIVTPATVNARKTSGDIHVTCNLAGYQETTTTNESYQSMWGAVDSEDTLKYKSPFTVVMNAK